MRTIIYPFLIAALLSTTGYGQEMGPEHVYELMIDEQMVNITGKEVMAMTVSGSLPGPTLRFKEGESAVIHVTNNMDMETSVHWHGLLLPNFQDGVPYLSTPPIAPGETFTYRFPLIQSGTYWYHSHTMLQEQSGVYGSIVIEPKESTLEYDRDLVIMLSDWTNEKPMNVLRSLKRGTEWYNVKKGTSTPLNKVITRGALGAQMNFWKQRMEGADIADIYYPAFLSNGKQEVSYPDFNPGERVRLRIINGGASSQFWLTFGGEAPMLVSADGLDVEPVTRQKNFIAIAETYDFILTIPESGQVEIRATAQDGSGMSSTFLGTGKKILAQDVPRPDKIAMMKMMASMDMRMGAPALKFRPKQDDPQKLKNDWGMQMDGAKSGNGHKMHSMKTDKNPMMEDIKGKEDSSMTTMDMNMTTDSMSQSHTDHTMPMIKDTATMEMTHMDMGQDKALDEEKMTAMDSDKMPGMNMYSEYNYDHLRSPHSTAYAKDAQVREVLLNLTGNMQRYIWSLNGIPLSETDEIPIKQDEVTRITFNNLTMMHHPMHLHGHFFRVINANGDYSPLKHTVNVPPMQELTIEFYGNEYGDWFMHCHVLYHMMGGMARVMSYGTPRDVRMDEFPVSKLIHETNKYYTWGMADASSQMSALNLVSSNIRNQFNLSAEYGYNENMEAELTYERYLYDYFRLFAGVNVENKVKGSLDELTPTAVVGIRFFTPYMFNLDLRVDNELKPRLSLGRSVTLFKQFSIFGYYEHGLDFGVINDIEGSNEIEQEIVWSAGMEYMLNKQLSITATHDSRFGTGGGLSWRF